MKISRVDYLAYENSQYESSRYISTEMVQIAVNKHFGTKNGWPLYPVDKIQEALQSENLISEDEVCIRFDVGNGDREWLLVGKLKNSKKSIISKIKYKLIQWLNK